MKDKKVSLVPLELKHIDILSTWFGNEEISKFNGIPFLFMAKEALEKRYLNKFSYNEDSLLILNHEGMALGMISYKREKPMMVGATVLIIIGDIENSYVDEIITDTLNCLADYLFYGLNFKRMTVSLAGRQVGVIEKLLEYGFIREAVVKEERYVYGQYMDSILLGLLKDEFIK